MEITDGSSKTRRNNGPPWWRSVRFQIAYLAFLGVCFLFFHRINLSMAIVCMVNHTAVDLLMHPNATRPLSLTANLSHLAMNSALTPEDTGCNTVSATARSEDGDLVWDKRSQGVLLGAYFWTSLVLQVPFSVVVRRFGPRLTMTISMVLASVLTLLFPVVARCNLNALIGLRLLLGGVSALLFVGLYAVWEIWAPPVERSRLVGITFSGVMASNAVVFPTSALLCGSQLGWPAIFYVHGVGGIAWAALWFVCVRDTADEHPWISESERLYIQNSIGKVRHTEKKVAGLPVVKVLTCVPFWANACVHIAFDWGLFLMLLNLPIYMKEVLHFDITSNGLYSMLPYVAMFATISVSGQVADRLIASKTLSVIATRKLITCIGQLVPAALLVGLSFLDCQRALGVVAMLTVALGVSGCNYSGFLVNYYDIAPRFASTLMTMANVLSMSSGIATPYLVAALTPDKTREQWQVVFFVSAGIFTAAAVVFVALGRGQPVPWATPPPIESAVADETESVVGFSLQGHPPPVDAARTGDVEAKLLEGGASEGLCESL